MNTLDGRAQQIALLFNQAIGCYQAGNWAGAEIAISRVLAAAPNMIDAIHLLALVRAAQGRHQDAETLFERALALNPRQAEIRCNLGNSLSSLGRQRDAIAAYRRALRDNAQFLPAYLGLGRELRATGDLPGAETAYRAALRVAPTAIDAHIALGAVLKDAGRPAEAEAIERAALALNPPDPRQRAALEHNLGVSLKSQGRNEEALHHYDRAQALAPDLPLADYSRANALQNLRRFDESVAAYRKALARNPLEIDAHRDFNQLLYRLGREDEFLHSYDTAFAKHPEATALPFAKGQTLLHCERYADAVDSFGRALALNPGHSAARDGLAMALARLGRQDEAIAAHEQVIRQEPGDPNPWSNFAQTLLQAGDARRALAMTEQALARSPHDQGALAMSSIALRALGDERDEDLMRYGDFIQVFDLDPPDGWSDMESFNRDLNTYLGALHTDRREHFDQTLRGGTQTRDRLFDAGHTPVEKLRARIEQAIGAYIQRMGAGENHPLTARRRDAFRFAGSWSSRLSDCGFHTNHIHPRGWISSCYYVALPDAVADAEQKQGWIKFGEPSFAAGLKDPIRRAIQPAPGRLVLFPSYMWHGTVPFHDSRARTTIAFDAVPVP